MNRELTQKEAQLNRTYCDEVVDLRVNIEKAYLEVGRRLLKIRDERMFEPFYDNFSEFVELEMGMTKGTASKIINVYETYIHKFGFSPVLVLQSGGYTILSATLKHVKTKRDAQKWLKIASENPRRVVEQMLTEKTKGVSMVNCKHKNYYTLRICRDCGARDVLEDSK